MKLERIYPHGPGIQCVYSVWHRINTNLHECNSMYEIHNTHYGLDRKLKYMG